MNTLDRRQLETHVPVVAWLLIGSHALFLLLAGFTFVLLVGVGFASHDPEATTILGIVGAAVGALLAVLSLPGLVAGFGLLARNNWARILALVVAALNLANFPVGTALAVYALWVLLQDEAVAYFAPQNRASQGLPGAG